MRRLLSNAALLEKSLSIWFFLGVVGNSVLRDLSGLFLIVDDSDQVAEADWYGLSCDLVIVLMFLIEITEKGRGDPWGGRGK